MSNVKVNMKPNWEANIARGLKQALLEMAVDIEAKAEILAPIETGALKTSGKVSPVKDGYTVSFGNSRVPYARRREFENRKNPQTKHYLGRAGDGVARSDKSKYFRGKINP